MIAALAMLIASVVTGTALAVDDTSMDSDTQTVQTDSDTESDDSVEATDGSADEEVSSDDIDTDSGSAGDEANVDDDSAATLLSDGVATLSTRSLTTLDSTSTPEITVNVFDYCSTVFYSAQCTTTGGKDINTDHALIFSNGSSSNEYGDWNTWTGRDSDSNSGVYQGIVSDKLDAEGYPTLNQSLTNSSESLKYLFDDTEDDYYEASDGVVERVLNADGLFRRNSNGYYYYDSADNFATLDTTSGSFTLYNQGRFPDWNDSSEDISYGAFLPFNDLDTGTNNYVDNGFVDGGGYKLKEGNYDCNQDQRTGQISCSDSQIDDEADYHFGMTVETSFYYPEDGQVNDEDMVFEFSGDDDVWVFIDGQLALDLGGISNNYGGSINFATGVITVDKVSSNNGKNSITSLEDVLGEDWNEEYATHTLKVFYLERGMGGSNCKFKFNLATIPSGTISIGKRVNGEVSDGTQFKFKAYVDYDGDTDTSTDARLYVGTYDVYNYATNEKVNDESLTATNGVITLSAGQYAVLTDEDITRASTYYIVESDVSAYDVTASGGDASLVVTTNNGDATVKKADGSEALLQVSDVSFVTVTNTVKTGSLTVTKTWGDSDTTNHDDDSVNVTLYRVKTGSSDNPSRVGESVQLNQGSGWSRTFTDLVPGYTYTVVEDTVPGYESSIEYTKNGQKQDGGLQLTVADVNDSNTVLKVTVTNTPSSYTYGIEEHLGLSKVLEGGTLQAGSYTFRLELVSTTNGDCTQTNDCGITLPDVTKVANGDADGSGTVDDDETDPSRFDFGEIVFTKPGTYVVKVSEVVPDDADSNVVYDEHVLYVKYVIGEDMHMTRYIANADEDGTAPDADSAWILAGSDNIDASFSSTYLTWTNWLVVSSLPLTGGSGTGLQLLLTGGTLGLLAAGAWLLARRRGAMV